MKSQDDKKLERAKKRVKVIKGFYTHLTIFIFVNLLILAGNINFFSEFFNDQYWFWRYLSSPVFWGIGLLIHGVSVLMPSLDFVKKWEARKMREIIERDNRNIKY
jgi:hypothetical protein|tara:strand:- start:157 stop:471 length:315 start_codon:yes stop_codon:yes gene_type:complete